MTLETLLWIVGLVILGVCVLLGAAFWVSGLVEQLTCEPEVWR